MKTQIKKISGFLVLALFLTTGISYSQTKISGDGNVVKEERKISSFDEIQISSAFEVYLKQGNEETLVLEADQNLMEHIKTEVVAGKLKIYIKKTIRRYDELNVYLTFKEIESIDISGAVEIEGQNSMKFDELEIEASGASEIELDLTANSLKMDISGASETELTGKAEEVKIECSGASDFDAPDLEVEHMSIDASGASNAKVYVNKTLNIDASGASTVKYKGNPTIESDISGAGTLRNIN